MDLEDNPELSVRRLSAMHPGICKSSVSNIIHKENLYPFHFRKVHAMLEGDFPARVAFSDWLRNKKIEDPTFFSRILFSDESTFKKDGIQNLHNSHHYAYVGDNPHVVKQTKYQHRFSINVWIGIVNNNLIGPVKLPDRLTGEEYLNFLQNILPTLLDEVPLNIRQAMWFMHDGCPAHFSRNVRQYLNESYGNQWIGRGGPVQWPARSPDLNPCDFCIWGFLKCRVYSVPIQTLEQLWLRVQNACNEFRHMQNIYGRIRRSLKKRITLCLETNGHHVEHLL